MTQQTLRSPAPAKQEVGKSRGQWIREPHVRHRDYSPTLRRFIERDPIGYEAGDNNWYRFVGNGPLSFVDASGLKSIDRDYLPAKFSYNVGFTVGSWVVGLTLQVSQETGHYTFRDDIRCSDGSAGEFLSISYHPSFEASVQIQKAWTWSVLYGVTGLAGQVSVGVNFAFTGFLDLAYHQCFCPSAGFGPDATLKLESSRPSILSASAAAEAAVLTGGHRAAFARVEGVIAWAMYAYGLVEIQTGDITAVEFARIGKADGNLRLTYGGVFAGAPRAIDLFK